MNAVNTEYLMFKCTKHYMTHREKSLKDIRLLTRHPLEEQ